MNNTPHPIAISCAEEVSSLLATRGIRVHPNDIALLITTHFNDVLQALDKSEEAIVYWKDNYDTEREQAEQEANQYKAQGDMYGWNFHSGRRSGIIENDIALYKLKDALTAITEAKKSDSNPAGRSEYETAKT